MCCNESAALVIIVKVNSWQGNLIFRAFTERTVYHAQLQFKVCAMCNGTMVVCEVNFLTMVAMSPFLLTQGMFGVNLAGLSYLKEQLARSGQDVFGDAQQLLRKKHKRT